MNGDWAAATERAAQAARQAGTLAPIGTRVETVTEDGLGFSVRVIESLERKRRAGKGKPGDPFAPPYDPDLLVGEVPPGHVGLLNKFPVLDRHLLIVTREYQPQTRLLAEADCLALLEVLRHWDGLGFYNGGPEAGASQPHKHLQVIDRPQPPGGPGNHGVVDALAANGPTDRVGHSERLPFPHARAPVPAHAWQAPRTGAAVLEGLYRDCLAAVGLPARGAEQPGPYNLLVTRDWLWVVPRRCQSHAGVEVNALGFAGALLVPDTQHLEHLRSLGPSACLRAVCP